MKSLHSPDPPDPPQISLPQKCGYGIRYRIHIYFLKVSCSKTCEYCEYIPWIYIYFNKRV
jgi:DNA repair photolyase